MSSETQVNESIVREIPTEYVVEVWYHDGPRDNDEKWICKTWDDVKAVISDIRQATVDCEVNINIEAIEVAG